jgi:hypothetical protein
VRYFAQTQGDKVKAITYTDVFAKLAVRFEQFAEHERNPSGQTAGSVSPLSLLLSPA